MKDLVILSNLLWDVTSAVNDDNVDIEHLPGDKTSAVAGDENNDEVITYLIVTNNTKGDLTIPKVDLIYEIIMWNLSLIHI